MRRDGSLYLPPLAGGEASSSSNAGLNDSNLDLFLIEGSLYELLTESISLRRLSIKLIRLLPLSLVRRIPR